MESDLRDVERALVGSVLMEPARVMPKAVERKVSRDWFTDPLVADLWDEIVRMWDGSGTVDGILIAQALPKCVGLLTECVSNLPTLCHVQGYIERLASGLLARQVSRVAMASMSAAASSGGVRGLDEMESGLNEIRSYEKQIYGGFSVPKSFEKEILADYNDLYEHRIVNKERSYFKGLKMPWDVLNVKYTGVKAGIHVVAARPSQGKSAFAGCVSAGMAMEGVKQLIFSVDMPPRLFVERYGCLLGQVSLPKLNFGGNRDDIARMGRGIAKVSETGNILMSGTSHIEKMIGEIYRAVRYDGVRCVWIDYLQILDGGRNFHTKKEEIDACLSKLKAAAIDLNIPIFTLAQINRESAKDPSKKPALTDLGDTGSIEREASTVLMLWVDPQVKQEWTSDPPMGLAAGNERLARGLMPVWLVLAKNQQGATGDVPFVFYKNYFMFRPADHDASPVFERDKNNRVIKTDNRPYFFSIRDDFLELPTFDEKLRAVGRLGVRGLSSGIGA